MSGCLDAGCPWVSTQGADLAKCFRVLTVLTHPVAPTTINPVLPAWLTHPVIQDSDSGFRLRVQTPARCFRVLTHPVAPTTITPVFTAWLIAGDNLLLSLCGMMS